MNNWITLAIAGFAALSLAAPDPAWAQARRGPSSGSSAGPRSSGGSDSGGGGGPRTAQPRSAPSGGGGGGQTTVSRGAPAARSSGEANVSGNTARARGARGVQGVAQPRQYWPSVSNPIYRPAYPFYPYYPYYGHGYYDPWYGYGHGYGYGYGYGYPWYPYGFGLSVAFGYPYGPYGGCCGYGYGGYHHGHTGGYAQPYDPDDDAQADQQASQPAVRRVPTGSVRLRANPKEARVYVDGALVGIVDDFDGLTDHLQIAAGTHQLELRAPGFESYTTDISVRAGRTVTERASLRPVN